MLCILVVCKGSHSRLEDQEIKTIVLSLKCSLQIISFTISGLPPPTKCILMGDIDRQLWSNYVLVAGVLPLPEEVTIISLPSDCRNLDNYVALAVSALLDQYKLISDGKVRPSM